VERSARAGTWGAESGWDSVYFGSGFWSASNLLRPGWSKIRASDADRDRAAAQLREHCVAGRLSVDELSERLDCVFRAKTYGELAVPLRDLPDIEGLSVRPFPRRPRRKRRHGLRTVLAIVVLLWFAAHAVSFVRVDGAPVVWALALFIAVVAWRVWRLTSPAWWRRAVLEPGARGARRHAARRLSDHA
jgi:DUF1707 SHOCT-like domain